MLIQLGLVNDVETNRPLFPDLNTLDWKTAYRGDSKHLNNFLQFVGNRTLVIKTQSPVTTSPGSWDGAASLAALAQHKYLETLSMNFSEPQEFHWPSVVSPTFPALQFLRFGSGEEALPRLLQSMASPDPHLNALFVYCEPDPLYDILLAASLHLGLRVLRVECNRVDGPGEPLRPADSLFHIGSCNQLRILALYLFQPCPITDEDIGDLVRNLPTLRGLIIVVSGSRLTLRSLAVIAEFCPMIIEISLDIDATQGLDCEIISPPRKLWRIDPQRGRINDAEAVATFFRRLSYADQIEIGNTPDRSVLWNEVERRCKARL